MAPEQAWGKTKEIGTRADIYALGAILYELLTGRPPFRAASPLETLLQVQAEDPVPPSRLQPKLPRDLATICVQCLQKEPHKRYPTALALGNDLRRFLAGEPIRARPVRFWERGWRWGRRNAPLAITGAVAAMALVAGIVLSILFTVREFRAAASLRQEHELAERHLAESYMERAFIFSGQEQDYARGLLWLARALETAAQSATDLQRTIRASLSTWGRGFPPLKAILPQPSVMSAAAFSPDGRTVLTGNSDQTARLWDAVTCEPIGPPLHHQGKIRAVAFSPDGRTVLTGSYDGTARRWNAATGEPIGEPLQHPKEVRAVTFSPDGRTILTGCFDGMARRWDAASGQLIGQPLVHPRGINTVTFSPDGRTIATGGRDQMIRLWDAAIGQPLGEPLPHGADVRVVAFSPDGRTLLTAGLNLATLWDVATARVVHSFPSPSNILTAAFSPDGKAVLTGSADDQTARLWDAATGEPLGAPLRQQGWVGGVAFSPDGGTFLTAVGGKGPRLWNAPRSFVPGSLLRHPGKVLAVAFSPDGKMILTGASDNAARLWDAATGKELGQLPHQDRVKAVAFSPDGRRILTGSSDEKAQLWDVATLKPIGSPLHHPPAWLSGVAFSPDGKMVVTGGFDAAARRWDANTGKELDPPLRHDDEVRAVAFSPDGNTILTGSFDQTARLWDAAMGKPLAPILPPSLDPCRGLQPGRRDHRDRQCRPESSSVAHLNG
jgi:WD40 repeat protein